MTFDVSIDGKPWKIAIEPMSDPGRYQVTLKGRRRVVDAVWIDADTLSVVDAETHEPHEIGVGRDANGVLNLIVDGVRRRAIVEPSGREPFSSRASNKAPAPSSGNGRIVAPMPGRVVRVLVAVGDRVTARQPLVVVEAMKMENELRAPHDGIVRDVAAVAGTAIESGAVLLEIG